MLIVKCSPDAYVQMVLQLAYYRHYGTWTPTYESASTRLFLGGRTETVRSCSVDSVAFVKGFESKTTDVSLRLFLCFFTSHTALTLYFVLSFMAC